MYHCRRPNNLYHGNITYIDEDDTCQPRVFEWKGRRDGDEGSRFAAGCSILYRCKEGYLLKGDERGKCNMDGSWGQKPTCKKGEQHQLSITFILVSLKIHMFHSNLYNKLNFRRILLQCS